MGKVLVPFKYMKSNLKYRFITYACRMRHIMGTKCYARCVWEYAAPTGRPQRHVIPSTSQDFMVPTVCLIEVNDIDMKKGLEPRKPKMFVRNLMLRRTCLAVFSHDLN